MYQISVGALHSQAQNELQERYDSEDDSAVVVSLPRIPQPEKLDIKSCEQFLLELFEQWMSPYIQPRTPLALLSEATKAVSCGVVMVTDYVISDCCKVVSFMSRGMEINGNHALRSSSLANMYSFGICT